MRKQRLGRLKEIRERKNLSQKELAQRLSISQTYISKLERGEIAPSRKMIDELAYVLEVSETSLAVPSSDDQRTTPRAASLFDRTLKVIDRGVQHYGRALVVSSHAPSLARSRGRQSPSAKERSQLASAKNLQDRDALVKEFVRMLSPHERYADGANAIALCGSHGGLPALDPDNQDHAMIAAAIGRYLAQSSRTFTHIVRQVTSNRADDGANALVSGIELSMHFHCLDSQGIAPGKDKSAQQLYDRLPSRYLYLVLDQGERQDLSPDIYMVPDAGSLIAFPSPVHTAIENGLFIDGQEASCRSYLEFVAGVGRRPIEVFGPNVRDSERFQRQASRGVNRRYALYQGFLSAITRPVLHFRPGTPWWVRNAKRYATIQTIADYRRDRYHRAFSDNADEIQFRQICARDALEKWAETGKRTDLDAVDPR